MIQEQKKMCNETCVKSEVLCFEYKCCKPFLLIEEYSHTVEIVVWFYKF